MENEEWRMNEWRMEHEVWSVERGEWRTEHGEWSVECGAWRMENENGKQGMENGKLEMENSFFGKEFNDYYVVEKFLYPRFLSKAFKSKFNIRE